MVTTFPVLYGILRFITLLTAARYFSHPEPNELNNHLLLSDKSE